MRVAGKLYVKSLETPFTIAAEAKQLVLHLEAFEITELSRASNRPMAIAEQHRIGEHICYYSGLLANARQDHFSLKCESVARFPKNRLSVAIGLPRARAGLSQLMVPCR